jgi:hypothetical protein
MAEKMNDITGAQFVNADAALPSINISSDLVKTDLSVLGGEMEQAQDTVDQFGGPAAYFAKKEPMILKQAGMDTEVVLYYDNWKAKAVADSTFTDVGGTGGSHYSIMVVRFEEGVNSGLFDPTGFKAGALLNRELINGGNLYHLRSKGTLGTVLGYGVALKGRFGWQNLSTKTVYGLVNISAGSLPTALMIDDAIAAVHGSPSDTLIMCHPKCRNIAIAPFKGNVYPAGLIGATDKPVATSGALQMGIMDKDFNRLIDTWNGIPIVTSYNLSDAGEAETP